MYLGVMGEQVVGGGWGGLMREEGGWRKGPWTAEEDRLLIEHVKLHGEGRWNSVARLAGLKRNGKSCRLRWVNYLRPDLKRGQITPHEERIILELHARWGNRWSTIARSLPGRTDNEIKNYWRTHFKKKGKPTLDDSAKKARLLRRQKFQQEQQLQQQQQQHQLLQQQLQQQQNEANIKKIMSFLDEGENKAAGGYIPQIVVGRQLDNDNKVVVHEDFQGFFYPMPMMFNNINPYHHVAEASSSSMNEEVVLWDGLWNLDDVHGHGTASCSATAKTSLQSLAMPMSFS